MRRQVTSNPGVYDLALIDVSLPAQRSGNELAGWLRALEGCANMRIVLFSGQSKQRLEALAANAGVDAVISKQDGPQFFLAEIRRVLAGQAGIGEEWPVE